MRIVISFLCVLVFLNLSFSKSLIETGKRGIVLIETPEGLGTGFILIGERTGNILVTNKHILTSCKNGEYYDSVLIYNNELTDDNHVRTTNKKSTLYLNLNNYSFVIEHDNPDIDMVFVPLGNMIISDSTNQKVKISNFPDFTNRFLYGFSDKALLTKNDIKERYIRTGTPVEVIGFTYFFIGKTQYHISRYGNIALYTSEEQTQKFTYTCSDTTYSVKVKHDWFILDIVSRQGNSGSPVFIYYNESPDKLSIIGIVKGGKKEDETCSVIPIYYLYDLLEKKEKMYRIKK